MKRFVRLRRASWKSKNNVYLYRGDSINHLLDDFQEKVDIMILPKGYNLKMKLATVDFFEIDKNYGVQDIDMYNDIREIDKIVVREFEGKAARLAVDLGKEYYWKNIIIFNP